MMGSIHAVDLFCGAGGLTYGLEQSGIDVIAGIDSDPYCRFPYEENTHARFIERDLRQVKSSEIKRIFPSDGVKLLAGCAPCQPFSTIGPKKGERDDRWSLLNTFSKFVRDIKPTIVTMENVPGLRKQEIFSEFKAALENSGYQIEYRVRDCREYGVPQKRYRLVLLASQLGEIKMIRPTHTEKTYRTVKETIGGLPRLRAGQQASSDPLHKAPKLSEKNLKRIKASKPGGTWKDWPENLKLDCHKKKSGSTYTTVYGRMKWNDQSPTITTQAYVYGTGRFGHPEQNRAITFREAALLQTFPKEYKFFKNHNGMKEAKIGQLIGNAVPVKLAEAIGDSIKNHLKAYDYAG